MYEPNKGKQLFYPNTQAINGYIKWSFFFLLLRKQQKKYNIKQVS